MRFAEAAEVRHGLAFLAGLPAFLRTDFPESAAESILAKRLASRESRFLEGVRKTCERNPDHPYRRLLDHAGFGLPDVGRLVGQNGIEGALRVLGRHGVFLTLEEFKGRRPIVRDSLRLSFEPRMVLTNPPANHFLVRTSGRTGTRTPVPIGLDYIRGRSIDAYLNLKACGGLGWSHALWTVPGTSSLAALLELACLGRRHEKWFSQVDPGSRGLHPRYRWSGRALRWISLISGRPLPPVTHVPLEEPWPIIGWMTETIARGKTPHLYTYPSSAVRLSLCAVQRGVSLAGAWMTVTGEPITERRLETLQRCGARILTRYGAAESGTIGYGCLRPDHPDEVHVLSDRLAIVAGEGFAGAEDQEGEPIYVTTLDPNAPFFLLNVSLGDAAVFSSGTCGCALEATGWKTRIHSISSSGKLTSGGMMFLRSELTRIVDDILPRRFGGHPTHYQLLEEEDDLGRPRLRLLIHPAAGPVDEHSASAALIEALSRGNGVERLTGLFWRDAGWVRVERRPPILAASGKIAPVMTLQGRTSPTRHNTAPGAIAGASQNQDSLDLQDGP